MDRKREQRLIAKIDELNSARSLESKALIPKSLQEIRPFPVREYDALIYSVGAGHLRVHRVFGARNSFVFDSVKTFSDSFRFWFGIALTILSPIAAIALAFLVSGWCLLLAFGTFVGTTIIAKTYDRAVFRAALSSEPAFCFLFWVRAINVFDTIRDKFFESPFDEEVTPQAKLE